MNAKVFEMKKEPVAREDRMTVADVRNDREGFVGKVADRVEEETDREEGIRQLQFALSTAAKVEGEKVTIVDKKIYAAPRLKDFSSALKRLLDKAEKDGEKCLCEFDFMMNAEMNRLNKAFENKLSHYVKTGKGIIPLDRFMKEAKEGDVWYVGGIVNYHF